MMNPLGITRNPREWHETAILRWSGSKGRNEYAAWADPTFLGIGYSLSGAYFESGSPVEELGWALTKTGALLKLYCRVASLPASRFE